MHRRQSLSSFLMTPFFYQTPTGPRETSYSPSPHSHLLVEGVPAGVDFFHVMLQPLDVTVFPGALDESLTNSIDLL